MTITATNGIKTQQYIKPQGAKGKLVSSSIFPNVKDTKYNFNALKHGLTGKANDHELGKLNDVGMKVGALALAGYLATQKATPKTKLMEFVGLATFFGAMKLWPKLAIGAPAKAIHGFDPTQEYEDSFGRKKPFFQDAQYQPWDVYSNEQLQKIGDKMGVDKNAQDRNDLTKSNMTKIATKNNTLWMITAGIASAVFSALACNKAEKVIDPALDKVNNEKADKLLQNFDTEAQKRMTSASKDMQKDLDKIFEENKGKTVDNKLIEKISGRLAKGLDPVTEEGVKEDMQNILMNGKSLVNEGLAEKISNGSKKVLAQKFSEEQVAKIVPSKEEIVKHFNDNQMMGREVNEDEAMNVRSSVSQLFLAKAKEQGMSTEKLKTIKKGVALVADKALKSNSASVLDENAMKKVSEIGKAMSELQAKDSVLDDYAQAKVADKPETVIANYWNKTSTSIVKSLGIDFKEMEKVRNNRQLVQGLVRNKMEEVTSDDAKYQKAIGEMANNIAELDKKIKPEDTRKYVDLVGKTYDDAAGNLYNQGMEATANKLTALSVGGKGSLKRVKQVYFEERVAGVKNSFSRMINTMDVYRRISKGEVPKDGSAREVKEAMLELVKQTTLQGHSSDHSIKFYFNRSQDNSTNVDRSDVEIKDGKVVNKYFKEGKGVDVPEDYGFYQKAMNFMYNSPMDKDTVEAIKKAGIEKDVNKYNSEVYNKIGSADYFTKPNHKTTGDQGASSEYKFLLLGVAPDEMMTKTVQQSYNSQKWGKTFGTVGAVLTGLTVAAQFLFGKGKAVK
ncbi:MAG: hypothetical protein DKM23_01830 [Candidatus Melainabacteria bacterium]|nr:MAG: hypothetical protein DKM23_01830 [Candidatus Melainabacteria bacterium]